MQGGRLFLLAGHTETAFRQNGAEGTPIPPAPQYGLVSELLALNLEGFSLFFPGSEAGLLESVEHGGVPVPSGVGHRLVEGVRYMELVRLLAL